MGTADFSIAAWIQTNLEGAAIVGKSNGDRSWSFHEKQFYLSQGNEQGAPVAGGVHFYGNQAGEIWGNTPVDEGQWTHVAATYDGARMRLYQNGVEVGSVGKVGTLVKGPAVQTWIGANPGGSRFFDGTIDEVKFFSVALSVAEIQELMNSGAITDRQAPTAPTSLMATAEAKAFGGPITAA